ncbi:MAG: endolytic transglycosylase MltG, partial [Desulfohalobiaceae bacterium]
MTPTEKIPSPAPRRQTLRRVLTGLVLLLLAAALALAWWVHGYLNTPAASPGRDIVLSIPPGQSFSSVVDQLQDRQVITGKWKFTLLGRLTGTAGRIKAGEVLVHTGWTPPRILEALASGTPHLYRLQVPEGLTWWQAGQLVEASGLADYESFAAAVQDPELLEKWGIPGNTAEGFLFPETYFVPRPENKDARPIVEAMLAMFWKKTRTIWPENRPDPETLMHTVTLASIVEKESSLPGERPLVAGVFANRLQQGMLLQADPTVIYGLGTAFDGNIRRSHLRDRDNPYNT